jgi:predicted O-linked N-acetylglucosamine transferase (SPINDLY family)
MLAEPRARGATHDASPSFRRCLDAPGDPASWLAFGQALRREGDASEAERAFAQAAALACDPVAAALQRVEAELAAGEGEAELARLDAAAAADPLSPATWTARGMALERLGRRAAAIDSLEVAATLAPEEPRTVTLLAALLARSSRLKEADAALLRARALSPGNSMLANDHAAVLMRLYRFSEARAMLVEAVAQDAGQIPALCNLAGATAVLGLQEEAEEVARRAIAAAPDLMQTWRTLCNVLPYRHGAARDLLGAMRACAERMPRRPAPPPCNSPDPDRRLRVGLLSGSLREHPVGWLTVAGFETLDPAGFELVALAQADSKDTLAQRFHAIAEWHAVDGMDDEALAAHARAIGIDVLIELGGHGDNARLPACALRLAPVQVKWVGMQYHSTGLAEMDWFVTDRWETPPHLAAHYSERLMILPDGYVCYSPPSDAPDVGPPPAVRRGHVTFGCFNNLAKITPAVLDAWSRVLRRTPAARIVLKTQAFADAEVRLRALAEFSARGVSRDRVELRGGSSHRAFLSQYGDVDMVLDPFPYSGGLTTCEALWMGVPVLTLPGETFASRHSASHVSNVGLADWIAADVDAYVDQAVRRAGDVEALAALRSELRARVKASPLCDAPRFGRSLGAALRRAWRDWCAQAAA